jgi:hypothetical protein
VTQGVDPEFKPQYHKTRKKEIKKQKERKRKKKENVVFIYSGILFSPPKKKEILSFASKWMELKNIILCKVSQSQKVKNHMFSLICGL